MVFTLNLSFGKSLGEATTGNNFAHRTRYVLSIIFFSKSVLNIAGRLQEENIDIITRVDEKLETAGS